MPGAAHLRCRVAASPGRQSWGGHALTCRRPRGTRDHAAGVWGGL